MKSKAINEATFLALLEKVLPTTTSDVHLATKIYEAVAKEVRLLNCLSSFEKFCEKESLPNLEAETVAELQSQLTTNFGEGNVTITPDEKGEGVAVEITLPDRTVDAKLRVRGPGEEEEEGKVPFVPFVVTLPADPELVWALARREDLGPDEAARALATIEEEFWATKAGQKLQQDRVERTFAEFIARVPAAALAESGLKRHYKEPEPLRTLRLLKGGAAGDRIGQAA